MFSIIFILVRVGEQIIVGYNKWVLNMGNYIFIDLFSKYYRDILCINILSQKIGEIIKIV